MNLQLLLQNRKVRLGIAGAVLILVLSTALFSLKSCDKKEPTVEELREQHLTYLVQVIEAYKQRYGSYPQPTARAETPEGVKHVWGYEPEKPSLASCTVHLDEAGTADAEKSRCGGGVYDINGNLIGWKGTFTLESGLNNIEIAGRSSGRVSSPVSEFISIIPIDPLYEKNPAFKASGFGEYVYAIRNPEAPGGEKREEYQIAATVDDPLTGEERTTIRGNYFVRAEERDRFPGSLIGPGLLFDSFGNPVEGQTRPIHVLLDGQKKGFPNPVLGDGESTLRILTLERRARRLLQSIEERMVILTSITGDESAAALEALTVIRADLQSLLAHFDGAEAGGSKPSPDLDALEANLALASGELSGAMETFIASRALHVGVTLMQEVDDRDAAIDVLRSVFESLRETEELVLIARDDVLTYLDKQGIEEQTRNRVGRKIEEIKEELPDLQSLFEARNLVPMDPFLAEDLQTELSALRDREGGAKEFEISSGSGSAEGSSPLPAKTYAVTLSAELFVHVSDLRKIMEDLLDELLNAKAPLEEIDASLKNLAAALETEHERINALFDDLATVEEAEALKNRFIDLKSQDALRAIRETAESAKGFGDFAPLLFDSALLDRVILEQSPGIPDTGAHANELEALYKGIPYPLP